MSLRYSFILVLFTLISGTPVAEEVTLLRAWEAPTEAQEVIVDTTGHQHALNLHGVTALYKQEDLVDHPHFYFDGQSAYAEADPSEDLNPETLTISLWFRVGEGPLRAQVPLVVKSLSSHIKPWYQYGLFLMDSGHHPQSVIFYASAGEKPVGASTTDVPWGKHWNHLTATYDGETSRIYFNGEEIVQSSNDPAPLDSYATPLTLGAYANLDKTQNLCFNGAIASVAIYEGAMDAAAVQAVYTQEKAAYPQQREEKAALSAYAIRLNEVLRADRDVWGEALIAQGGATYENIKDYLHPLFYSTGYTYEELGVHNLLWGHNGGEPPYIIPLADGSRITADRYDNENDLEIYLWDYAGQGYGEYVELLETPALEEGYYPILHTKYTDTDGNFYQQESFAASLDGVPGLAAFVRLSYSMGVPKVIPEVRFRCGNEHAGFVASVPVIRTGGEFTWDITEEAAYCTVIWHPEQLLSIHPDEVDSLFEQKKSQLKAYWDTILAQGAQFEVPEQLVMDAQRNLLIQNLILRWRYSLGAVVYHGSFYQPESSDAVQTLGLYGYTDAYRDGLAALIDMTKGAAYYANWERGEKLTHAAHYYHLTRDKAYIEAHTPEYQAFCDEFCRQIAEDPNGLLQKERQCGDIPQVSYFVWHQVLGWRGLRDMAVVWKAIGRDDLYEKYFPIAEGLNEAIGRAMESSQVAMPDGTLFIPRMLLEDAPVEAPVTATRLGSYWNLCMPYAFGSGFWEAQGEDMDRIVGFMRNHGSFLLGLLRFNYYPTPIGSYRNNGLPGYYTTGFDNVYLPDYLELIAERDEADQLVLSFYAKLAHGLTRGTFVSGEGATVGEKPGEIFRSCYGSPSSANNNAFLLPLRLMLVRETFRRDTGEPEVLYLAHATPREWLEDGKTIRVSEAPTCFGKVGYILHSQLSEERIDANLNLPARNPAETIYLKLRVPQGHVMAGVQVNGKEHTRYDPEREVIDLCGLKGDVTLSVRYHSR